jgi:hypothetical protein
MVNHKNETVACFQERLKAVLVSEDLVARAYLRQLHRPGGDRHRGQGRSRRRFDGFDGSPTRFQKPVGLPFSQTSLIGTPTAATDRIDACLDVRKLEANADGR